MKRYAYVAAAALLIGLVGGVLLTRWWQRPADATAEMHDNTRLVTVQRSDLRPQDVAPHVTSPTVVPLVSAAKAKGGSVQVVAETRGEVRLSFPKREQSYPIEVRQPVEAVAVMGKDKQGQPTASLDVFQVQPDGTRQPIADSQTTVIRSTERARWHLGVSLQAGAGYVSTLTGQRGAVAVISLPWLRHGQGHAEDSSWALLSPGVVLDAKGAQPAVQPFAWNAARVIPLLGDVWIGPVVSWDVKAQKPRIGASLSATF